MKAQPNPAGHGSGCLGFIEGRIGSILVYFVILPLMACLLLVLPPIELPNRILNIGYVSVAQAGLQLKHADGTTLVIPEGAVASGTSIKLDSTPLAAFVSSQLGKTLPSNIEVKSPLYTFAVKGERPKQATLSVPIPRDAGPNSTLDLYARFGEQWFKIPFVLNAQASQLDSDLNFVPDSVFVAQTKPQPPSIGAVITTKNSLPGEASKVIVQVHPTGLRLADEGSLAGDIIAVPETSASSPYSILPTVTNVDETGARLDLTEDMLTDSSIRATHIRTLVDLAVQKLYAGYNLDYQGLGTQDRELFTTFIKELAQQLHSQQKMLSVMLPLPRPVSEDVWDTAGYNWALIGRYADQVMIPLLSDPRAYEGDTPLIEQYLQWSAGQVDRFKLQVVFSSLGRDEAGRDFTVVGYNNALKLLGPIGLPKQVHPGDPVTLELPQLRTAGGIQQHEPSGLFYFNYKDANGTAHTVWLENADSLAKGVTLLLKYNLHGVAVRDVESNPTDPRIWDVLTSYRSLKPLQLTSALSIVWLADGKKLGTSTSADPRFNWTVPNAPGDHAIDVALSIDNGANFAPSGQQLSLNVAAPATPTPIPPTPKPTATQVPTSIVAAPQATAIPAARPTTAPAPPVSTFAGRTAFGYGAQINWTGSPLGPDGEMATLNSMGFGWAKIQVRWCDIEGSQGNPNPSSLDNIINVANAHGIKLLFSVVCGPAWTGAVSGCGGCNPGPPSNPQDLANFLGSISGRYCGKGLGAIEVWNEENLRTEWGQNPISPGDYMRYLGVSRLAIKAACPAMIVVSGAPTPTGGDGGATAMDDIAYLSGLYAAGLKNNTDAVGAHPSGFNCPVDADWRTVSNPTARFRGPFDNHHHSWCFRGTMDGYRNVMVASGDANKQIWPTEFGWGVTNTPAPGYEYELDNTSDQQAQWLVRAYQYGKTSGWVGVMFLWNLDFNNSNADNRAFAILGTPAQGALAAMPK